MSDRCPKCAGTGKLAHGLCDCITGTMLRVEAADGYVRSRTPSFANGAQTSTESVRSRALLRRRAAIAAAMLGRRVRP